MEKFTIGTFNLRNHYWDPKWDGNEFPKLLANFLREYNISYLGTRELRKEYAQKLKVLLEEYTISGEYRYKNLPFINQFNEANAIISKEKPLETETIYLAKYPIFSHLTQNSRIATTITTPTITLINTHLENWHDIPRKNQLLKLYHYILSILKKEPIITGDFNMDIDKEYFKTFVKTLEGLEINHITNNIATYPSKNDIIDHIFIPNSYEIEDVKVITTDPVNQISDHRPLIVKVKKK